MQISALEHYLNLNPSQLANTIITCPYCGKNHTIPFREVTYGSGIIQSLPEVIDRSVGRRVHKVGVIYDRHIEGIIESSVFSSLSRFGTQLLHYPLGAIKTHLEPSAEIGREAATSISPEVEILIGIGSGVICDLTKYIADIKQKPFILVGTANSMNAYTSITGIITENKFKVSKFLKIADAILLDTDVLSQAPIEMTLAGIGDLSARSICNADFRLSHLLRKTWFCPLPYLLTHAFENKYFLVAEQIGRSEIEAIDILSQANLISGYSMTMVDGETFPSSGAEHVFSHFLDLQHELYGAHKNLHGTQVGIGTLINLTMYDFLRKLQPNQFSISKIIHGRQSLSSIQKENLIRFGASGDEINRVVQQKWMPDDLLEVYLKNLLSHWEEIWIDLDPYIAAPSKVYQVFKKANFPLTIDAIHRHEDEVLDALLFGSRYRARYTILDLMWELGLFPDAVHQILAQSSVLS